MSTRYLRATHQDGRKTALHDSDFPLDLLAEVYQVDPDVTKWRIDLLNYAGELLESNVDWRTIHVHTTLAQLAEGLPLPPSPADW